MAARGPRRPRGSSRCRPGRTPRRSSITVPVRSRKSRSRSNRIPKVWTLRQRGISRPAPARSRLSSARPSSRAVRVVATGTSHASTRRRGAPAKRMGVPAGSHAALSGAAAALSPPSERSTSFRPRWRPPPNPSPWHARTPGSCSASSPGCSSGSPSPAGSQRDRLQRPAAHRHHRVPGHPDRGRDRPARAGDRPGRLPSTASPVGVATLLFLVYSATVGVTFALMFELYTTQSIFTAFLITAGMFGALAIWGAVTDMDLSKVGSIAFMALIGLILATIVNVFWANETLYWVTTYVGVLDLRGADRLRHAEADADLAARASPARPRAAPRSSAPSPSTSTSSTSFSSCCASSGARASGRAPDARRRGLRISFDCKGAFMGPSGLSAGRPMRQDAPTAARHSASPSENSSVQDETARRGNYESGADYVLEYGELRFSFNERDFAQRVEQAAVKLDFVAPGPRRARARGPARAGRQRRDPGALPPPSANTSTRTGRTWSGPPTRASCTGFAGSSSAAPGSTSGSRRASSTSSSTRRTQTFGYVQPDRDSELIELSAEPSWAQIAYGGRDRAVA